MSNPGPAVTSGVGIQNLSSNQAIRLLGKANSVSMNAVADTIIPMINTNSFSVAYVLVTNASASLAQAHGALYTAPAAGGTAIVADAALSGASSAAKVVQMTVASTDNPGVTNPQTNLYFRVGTVNTAAATADVYIYGYAFDNQLN